MWPFLKSFVITEIKEEKPIVGILGFGEIGESLKRVYDIKNYQVIIRDPFKNINSELSKCDIVNICIPYFSYNKFLTSLKELNLKNNCIVIIHSTIEISTTNKIQIELPNLIFVHSPVRGVHPNLYEGLITFEKYIGFSDRYYKNDKVINTVVNHLKYLNIKPVVCSSKESELAKLISTTLYGVNIAAVEDVGQLCDKFEVNFDKVYTNWQKDYNEGYKKLGVHHVQRPVLKRIPNPEKIIGGHCVIPNSVILKNIGEENLSKFVLRYSNEEAQVHKTGAKH